jgi:hypothetical protein
VAPSGFPKPVLSTTSDGLRVVFQTDSKHEFGGFVAAFSAVVLNEGSNTDAATSMDSDPAEKPVFTQLPSAAEAGYGEAAQPESNKSRLVLFALLGALALVVVAVFFCRRTSNRKQDRAQAAWMVAGNNGALVVTSGSMGRDDQVGVKDLFVNAVLRIYSLLVCSSSRMSASFSTFKGQHQPFFAAGVVAHWLDAVKYAAGLCGIELSDAGARVGGGTRCPCRAPRTRRRRGFGHCFGFRGVRASRLSSLAT